MSARWGRESREVLDQLHPDLRRVVERVRDHRDLAVREGYRGELAQNTKQLNGRSRARWGQSAHNYRPVLACHLLPWPVDDYYELVVRGQEIVQHSAQRAMTLRPVDSRSLRAWAEIHRFGAEVVTIGRELGIAVAHGGDWDGDGNLRDQTFDDLFHFELRDWRALVGL